MWLNDNLRALERGDQRKSEMKRICKVNESNVNSFNYQNQHLKGCNLIQLHKSLPVPLCNWRRPQLIVIVTLPDNITIRPSDIFYSASSVYLRVGQWLLPAALSFSFPPSLWTNLGFSNTTFQLKFHCTALYLCWLCIHTPCSKWTPIGIAYNRWALTRHPPPGEPATRCRFHQIAIHICRICSLVEKNGSLRNGCSLNINVSYNSNLSPHHRFASLRKK